MRIKSKYKIARRLGPAVFEKTQTQKFASRNGGKKFEGGRGVTDFGKAMLEKQKARFTYIVGERQFKRYASLAIAEKKKNPENSLLEELETRLDNLVSRFGLAKTRLAARQMVNHGHISVNGKRVSIPSYKVSVGDVIAVMPRSRNSKLFADVLEFNKDHIVPPWLSFDAAKLEGKVLAAPKLLPSELSFNIATILDFYKR